MKTINLAKKFSFLALAGLVLAAGSAQAHGWNSQGNPYLPVVVQVAPQHGDRFERDFSPRDGNRANVDRRQEQQLQRIRHGIETGQLDRREARDLVREQRKIERTQRRFLADGQLSRNEWIYLDRLLDQASANIRDEKHDRNWR